MLSVTPIVKVENLSKQYRIGTKSAGYTTLRESLTDALRSPFATLRRKTNTNDRIWALRDVSFTVMPGEAVGIIGQNGAGKSTLLKILSRIVEPTAGRVELRGRVGSLLEVGTGFHPELTGRENIFLNGAILGMTRKEITKRFDEIVEFANLEKFLDTPVKRYSTGMHMRLAFSVAAHFDPEILLVDEVLAVGDAEFQKKCLKRMGDVASEGRTVLLVSHNLGAIKSLCSRAVYVKEGRVAADDTPEKVIPEYIGLTDDNRIPEVDFSNDPKAVGEEARIISVRLKRLDGGSPSVIPAECSFLIEIDHEWLKPVPHGRVSLEIRTGTHQKVFVSRDDDHPDLRGFPRRPGRYRARCLVPDHLLNHGDYLISAFISIPGVKWCVMLDNVVNFSIDALSGLGAEDGGARPGLVLPLLKWELERY